MEISGDTVRKLKLITLAEDFAGYSTEFHAQHGICFLLEIEDENGEKKNILFDTGTDAQPIFHNAEILGVDLKQLDTIFLSHCHYDHTGGLIPIMQFIDNENVPIIAHPDIFRLNLSSSPYLRHAGIGGNVRKRAEELGGLWILTDDPLKLTAGVATTGEIPPEDRIKLERSSEYNAFTIEGDKKLEEDRMLDDVSLAADTPKGLVVITGCSHAGIASIVKKCKNMMGARDVEAVIGGFHLLHADRRKIEKLIEELKNMGVRNIYTGHCTGLNAECALKEEFGEKFHKLHCGMKVQF